MIATVETTPGTGFRVLELQTENWLRLRELTVQADGHSVAISGPNGSGKTSIAVAIEVAVRGLSKKQYPEPIHRGEDFATINLTIASATERLKIQRRFTAKSQSLIVTRADGSRMTGRVQDYLDTLLAEICLDPGAFLDLRPCDQVDEVLRVCGVQPPVVHVQEITGEHHESRPGESASAYLDRLSADEVGLYYVRRRVAGQAVEQKKGALEEQRAVVHALGGPDVGERTSAVAMLEEIDQLQQQADGRRALQQEADEATATHEDVGRQLRQVQTEQAIAERRVVELEQQLREVRAAVEGLRARATKGQATLERCRVEMEAAQIAAGQAPDHAPRMTELRRQIQQVEATNAARAKRQAAQEQLERLAKEVENAHGEHGRQEKVLEALRHERLHLLDGVDLGVEGLEVGHGELRLRGVSFRQASTAQQIDVGIELAMRQNPELRLIRLDNAERLDGATMAHVYRRAAERGCQVFAMRVADTQELTIEVVRD